MQAPVRAALPMRSSPRRMSRLAIAAAAPTGCPRYAQPWAKAPTSGDPAWSTDHTRSETITPESGK